MEKKSAMQTHRLRDDAEIWRIEKQ